MVYRGMWPCVMAGPGARICANADMPLGAAAVPAMAMSFAQSAPTMLVEGIDIMGGLKQLLLKGKRKPALRPSCSREAFCRLRLLLWPTLSFCAKKAMQLRAGGRHHHSLGQSRISCHVLLVLHSCHVLAQRHAYCGCHCGCAAALAATITPGMCHRVPMCGSCTWAL